MYGKTRKSKMEIKLEIIKLTPTQDLIDDLIGGSVQLCEIPDSDLPRIAKSLGLLCDDKESLRFCISERIDSISRTSYKSLVECEFELDRNPRRLFSLPDVLDFALMG